MYLNQYLINHLPLTIPPSKQMAISDLVYNYASIYSLEMLNEGIVATPYQGSMNGNWNIGVGHNMTANGLPSWLFTDAVNQWANDPYALFKGSQNIPYPDCMDALKGQSLNDNQIGALLFFDLSTIAVPIISQALPDLPEDTESAKVAALLDLAFNMGDSLLQFDAFFGYIKKGCWPCSGHDLRGTLYAKQLPERCNRNCKLLETGKWSSLLIGA